MTAPPVVTVTYLPGGVAAVVGTWGTATVQARARWSIPHAVWLPGVYDCSHRVGLHGGRLALVQQGRATMRVCDYRHHLGELSRATIETRRHWARGWNLHDDRGALEGCIGVPASSMLDLLGLAEMAREAGAEQHRDGGVFVTLRVEHRP
jgi:hypothetical protein